MATAQQQLDGFLQKYSPEMEKLGRDAIAHMRKRLPGAICLVYDNYNALAVGFGPDDKPNTLPLSIALYPRWANLVLHVRGDARRPGRPALGQGRAYPLDAVRHTGRAESPPPSTS